MNLHSVRLLVCFIFAGLMFFPCSTAQEKPSHKTTQRILNNQELIAAFSGKTHIGFYRDYLERYGSVKFVEDYLNDGTLSYQGGDITTEGFWRVINNHI